MCVTVLVVHDARSSAIYDVPVDKKGASSRVVDKVLEILAQLGYAGVVLKLNPTKSRA